MSPREVANLFNRPEHIQRIRSVIYPMQVAKSGAFLSMEGAQRSNIHFLLDFLRGAKFWQPDYGVDLDQLEQAGVELDILLPVVSFQLRQNIEDYVPRVSIDGIILTRNLQGNTRSLRFDLLYRTLNTNRIARVTIDDTLIQRAVQPNIVPRDKFISNSVEIPWESEPPPAVDPFLSLARSSQDQAGWLSWGATETMATAPAGTNSASNIPIATGSINAAYGGAGRSGYARRMPDTVPFSTRHAGGWGLYYRGLVSVDPANTEYLQAALWGIAQDFNYPGNGAFAYFEVIGVGIAGSRVPTTLRAVTQDGESSGQQTEGIDLGINMIDEPHLLEIVVIPGAVKFFVDGEEKHNNAFTIPPNSHFGSRFVVSHAVFGDDPPGGGGASFPTGFFTSSDGLRYERVVGGGGCASKALEQRYGFFDYPDNPPV